MSGDALVPSPDYLATRAITINAPPRWVWPGLAQIGSGRAGWYAIDWIDNAGVRSAIEILSDHQRLGIGDVIPMIAGTDVGPRVRQLEVSRRMLWADDAGQFSWEWLLEPVDNGRRTRLINWVRAVAHPWTRRMGYELLAAHGAPEFPCGHTRRRGQASIDGVPLPGIQIVRRLAEPAGPGQ